MIKKLISKILIFCMVFSSFAFIFNSDVVYAAADSSDYFNYWCSECGYKSYMVTDFPAECPECGAAYADGYLYYIYHCTECGSTIYSHSLPDSCEGCGASYAYLTLNDDFIIEDYTIFVHIITTIASAVGFYFTGNSSNLADALDDLFNGDDNLVTYVNNEASYDSATDSYTFSAELLQTMKELLTEYATANQGFYVMQTIDVSDIEASYFTNAYSYYTLRYLVQEASANNGFILFNGYRETQSSCYFLFLDTSDLTFDDVAFVGTKTGSIWMYSMESWEQVYRHYYYNVQSYMTQIYYTWDDYIDYVGNYGTYQNSYTYKSDSTNQIMNMYYYTFDGSVFSYNYNKNTSGYSVNPYFLITEDSQSIRVYETVDDFKNYTAGQRTLYYTSQWYEDITDSITASADEISNSISNLEAAIELLTQSISDTSSEDEIESTLEEILAALQDDSVSEETSTFYGTVKTQLSNILTQLKNLNTDSDSIISYLKTINTNISSMLSAVKTIPDDIEDTLSSMWGSSPSTVLSSILTAIQDIPDDIATALSGSSSSVDMTDTNDLLSDILTAVMLIPVEITELLSASDFTIQVDMTDTNVFLENIDSTLSSIRRWLIADTLVDAIDTVIDAADVLADFGSLLLNLADGLTDGADDLLDAVAGLGDVGTSLMTVFPFCIPWDIAALLNLLVVDAQAPCFEIPVVIAALDFDTVITVDFSEYEILHNISTIFLTLLYSVILIKLTFSVVEQKQGDD